MLSMKVFKLKEMPPEFRAPERALTSSNTFLYVGESGSSPNPDPIWIRICNTAFQHYPVLITALQTLNCAPYLGCSS
jgi:hypothetical protein